ncbi:hypothetical protein ACTFIW_011143 [Dictyostelium discoideum]
MESNSNKLEDNETCIELEKKDLKSIEEIAQSYSISTNKLNKADIIEPTEILFWKLFRNIVIYKKIFSFMDSRFSINYDSMSSISNLINNNQFNILKEKVYRNCRYLHYTSNNCEIEPSLLFVKLFSTIKNDDYKFYRNFLNSKNCYYDSYSSISKALILSKNLEIYKLYINEFNYKPTETDLFYSIIIGSNKFIKYILELNSTKSSSSSSSSSFSPSFSPSILKIFFLGYKKLIIDIYKSYYYPIEKIKIFKGLLCFFNIIGDHSYEGYEKNHHQIAIDDLVYSFTNNPYAIDKDPGFNERSTLETLITICKLILLLKKSIDNEITLIKDDDDDDDDDDKKELRKSFKSIPMYLCYYDYDDDGILDYNDIVSNKYKVAFKFGNCHLLQGVGVSCDELLLLPNKSGNFTHNPHWKNDPLKENFIVLFSHCFDQEKKIKFIDQLIERNTKKQDPYFQNDFFYMLIMHGDIELLKYFSNKVGTKLFYFHSHDNIIPPTYYIESIEMLDYLFNNHRDYLIDIQFPNYYCTFYKSLQLLQHFESLLIQYKSNNPSIIEKDPISFISYNFDFKRDKNYIDFLYHFLTNSPPYLITIKTYEAYSIGSLKLADIEFNYIKLRLYNYKDGYCHFLFATDRCYLEDSNKTINFYYDFENVDFIFRFSSLTRLVNRLTPYLYEVNNFKFLNWFLTMIKNYYYSSNATSIEKSEIRKILHRFMRNTISHSRLKLLEYIHQNFDFILKEESDGGILTSDNLESYWDSTIYSGSIKVSEFLSQFITFPKDSLEFSNEKLKLYFSNKLKK